jgi:hypothetical protein
MMVDRFVVSRRLFVTPSSPFPLTPSIRLPPPFFTTTTTMIFIISSVLKAQPQARLHAKECFLKALATRCEPGILHADWVIW